MKERPEPTQERVPECNRDLEMFPEEISSTVKDAEISNFKTIESLAYFLQAQHGLEKFKKIYEIVAMIDGRSRGRIFIAKYTEELKEYLKPEEISKHLPLFLALSRMR